MLVTLRRACRSVLPAGVLLLCRWLCAARLQCRRAGVCPSSRPVPQPTYGLCYAAADVWELLLRRSHQCWYVVLYVPPLAEKVGSHHHTLRASLHTPACAEEAGSGRQAW